MPISPVNAAPEILLFEPLYVQRVWGGSGLAHALGRQLPPARDIGESWEIADREADQSRISEGPFRGSSLRELISQHGSMIMGPHWEHGRRFPLLVKWLDCRGPGSFQIHPSRDSARAYGGEPKTEFWYFAECEPSSRVYVGLKSGVTRDSLERAISSGEVAQRVRALEPRPGESILIPGGQIHATEGGQLILEIQQNSDTTYRVYDWGRIRSDGDHRELHIEDSLRSVDWDSQVPRLIPSGCTTQEVARCEAFSVRRICLHAWTSLTLEANQEPRIISVVEGEVWVGDRRLLRGANALLPFGGEFTLTCPCKALLLLTESFAT